MTIETRTQTYWEEEVETAKFPSLEEELSVDVAIIGGGIVGVSTARALKDRGLSVALIEARRVGRGVSGRATAKVTSQHGLRYTTIRDKFGEEEARLYAEAQEAGLRAIGEMVERFGLDADFERKPAFVYTREEKSVDALEKEVELAKQLGLPASLTRDTGLPYDVLGAMRWDNQAQFHPVKYVAGLAATIPGKGCHVFENSRVTDWEPGRVKTARGGVKARHVMMATNLPLGMTGGYFATNFPMAEPMIAAPLRTDLRGFYINAEQPGHSIRTHRRGGQLYAVCAGPHSRPGHNDEMEKNFADLEHWLTSNFDAGPVESRWVNEDYSPMDGAPFVGWSSSDEKDRYLVATGFGAWGFTNGAAAAMLVADLVEGKENPWAKLFDATRIKPVAGAKTFAKENAKTAADLVGGHFSSMPKSVEEVAPGQAAVLNVDGDDIAVFRDEQGEVKAVSAVCTHMGCILGWNAIDRTWDCPCHGSRFSLAGDVIAGPAVSPLDRKQPA
ncbi:MAG TPA: FAD-dependent oxidoreductase [Sphingomicrobium sp.]|nr:FAD-dependent oxidoreductase [Sphingomicrobium sp.]